MKSIMDEFIVYQLHEEDYNRLPHVVKTVMSEYEQIEFYPDGKKSGKNFDKSKEFISIVKKYKKLIKDKKGEESNEEGICVEVMTQLLSTMMLSDVRKLNLEKLLIK